MLQVRNCVDKKKGDLQVVCISLLGTFSPSSIRAPMAAPAYGHPGAPLALGLLALPVRSRVNGGTHGAASASASRQIPEVCSVFPVALRLLCLHHDVRRERRHVDDVYPLKLQPLRQ